jgi:hypothetical protein
VPKTKPESTSPLFFGLQAGAKAGRLGRSANRPATEPDQVAAAAGEERITHDGGAEEHEMGGIVCSFRYRRFSALIGRVP